MIEKRYIRNDLCPGILHQDLSSSLWNIFEHVYSYKPFRHSQSLRIIIVSGKFAQLLEVEDVFPVYLIKGITYLQDGRAIECEESLYRGDKYEITFEAVAV